MPPNVIDPYFSANQVLEHAKWTDQPPTAAPPGTSADSVLQLYVPADHTLADFGTGSVPGIRMSTDRHVHLTAREPLTTISLGAPHGDGVTGTPGLNVFTSGDKRELVEGSTNEVFVKDTLSDYRGARCVMNRGEKSESVHGTWSEFGDGDKVENVIGQWTVGCADAKTETVDGTFTQICNSEHNIRAKKNSRSTYEGALQQDVGGDYVLNVKGRKFENLNDDVNQVFVGRKNTKHIGVVTSETADLSVSLNGGLSVSFSDASFSRTAISIAKKDARVEMSWADIKNGMHSVGSYLAFLIK